MDVAGHSFTDTRRLFYFSRNAFISLGLLCLLDGDRFTAAGKMYRVKVLKLFFSPRLPGTIRLAGHKAARLQTEHGFFYKSDATVLRI